MSYDRTAVVTGRYLIAFVKSTGQVSEVFEQRTRSLFEDELGQLDPEAWYSLETVAELYEGVRDDVGPRTMRQGGVATGEALPFDTDTNIAAATDQLNEEHKRSFRESTEEHPAGRYLYESTGDRSARVGVSEAYPFPESFVEGVFEAFIRRHGPVDASPNLQSTTAGPEERFVWTVRY